MRGTPERDLLIALLVGQAVAFVITLAVVTLVVLSNQNLTYFLIGLAVYGAVAGPPSWYLYERTKLRRQREALKRRKTPKWRR